MLRFFLFALFIFLSAAAVQAGTEIPSRVIISVRDQKLMLLDNGGRIATYRISTSKFGVGDRQGSMATPLGFLQVARKIGGHAPVGAVFRHRRFTGEVLAPNAPGRDPVLTRIIWLRGLERSNAHAFDRCIYIHGTPEERTIGRPSSYGCIRMKSRDVAALYNQIEPGAIVQIVQDRLPKIPKAKPLSPATLITDSAKPGVESLTVSKSPGQAPSAPASKNASSRTVAIAGVKA
jgi:lipoprotein-anchoring transpeptidase ErfK/SrfK